MSGRAHAVLTIVWKSGLKLLVLLFALSVGAVLYGNIFGIPDSLIKHGLEKLNRNDVAVIVDSAKLRGLTHLSLKNIAVYRKHVLGKSFFSASSATVNFSIAAWLRGDSAVAGLAIDDAVLIPKQGKGIHGSGDDGSHKEISFPVIVTNGRFHDMTTDNLEFQLVSSGGVIELCDLKATISRDDFTGCATGTISYDMNDKKLSGELVSHADPYVVMTFFEEYNIPFAGKLLRRFDFIGEAPRAKWMFYYYLQKDGDIYLTGDFRTRNGLYRGVEFLRADGQFNVSRLDGDIKAELNRLFVVRDEGVATVAFVAKPHERILEFEAESSLHPMAMANAVGILTNFLAKHVEFNGPSTVSARGVLDFGGSHSNSDFKAVMKGDGVSVDRLTCDSGSFDLQMQGRNVTLTNIEATAYGGTISGDIELVQPLKGQSNFPYRLNLMLDDADFEGFMKSVSLPERRKPYNGRLSMDLNVDGVSGINFINRLVGSGSVRISDGRVFMLPVFGGLSDFMTRIIPGLDLILRQSDMKSKFVIDNGLITTEKVAVEGGVLSLLGWGSYLIGGDLDFDVQVKLMKEHTLGGKVFRFLTYPLSKLFEFTVKGSLDDPHWYPENFSLDLLKKIGIGKEEDQ